MKKKIRACLLSLTIAAAGVSTVIPAALPQSVIAAEADYKVTRNIKVYIKQDDGSKKLHDTIAQTVDVKGSTSKDTKVTFPAVNVSDILGNGFDVYTPDKTTIPSTKGSYNNPPADASVVLSIDPSKALTKDKKIIRTIEYYTKGEDGKETFSGNEQYTVTFLKGAALTKTFKIPDKTVPAKDGYTPDRTVVKGKTVTPKDGSYTEKVIYTKNANVVTETKTVWRKINFIDKDTGEAISAGGNSSKSQGVTFSREVIKDKNGKVTKVVRDWQSSGTIKEFTIPDAEGYSHAQKKLPAVTVKPTDKDIEVDVEYVSTRYTVNYHLDENSPASSKKTVVNYGGAKTDLLTISQLGFSKPGYTFVGWKGYREIDGKWYVKDSNGNKTFVKLKNGALPEGYTFYYYKNGGKTRVFAKNGNVHFYGVWKQNSYTVKYHIDENSAASSKTTKVIYGKTASLLTVKQLGFSKTGKKFAGWKSYRESDDTWYVINSEGKKEFKKLNNGKLPSGYKYHLYKDGGSTFKFAKSGIAHFYATWK